MAYKVELSDLAKKQLKKLDDSVAKMILKWLKKNVDNLSGSSITSAILTWKHLPSSVLQ